MFVCPTGTSTGAAVGEDSYGGLEERSQLAYRLRSSDKNSGRVLQTGQRADRWGHSEGVPPWMLDHTDQSKLRPDIL